MIRKLKIPAVLLAAALAVLGLLWQSGQVERWLVDELFRSVMSQNVERQHNTPAVFAGRRPVSFDAFETELEALPPARQRELDALLATAQVTDIQKLLAANDLTALELSLYFLHRIKRHDPRLHSVTELNTQLLDAARESDDARSAGLVRGPLHGIPVLLKDNIAVAGSLHTTAGAAALADLRTGYDAKLVRNLRDAGALILGKAAMSEWANYTSSTLPNGFSALGGQVRNPYGAFDVSGSSSGSAVAVAAGLVPLSVGTETWGSLVSPASQNAVVTIKPTHGRVSTAGVIPLVPSRDTAGPMARSVADAALLLAAMAGDDSGMFDGVLRADGLQGLRLGVLAPRAELFAGDHAVLERALTSLERAGSDIVRLPASGLLELAREVSDFELIAAHNFARSVDAFLADTPARLRSLAHVVAFNAEDPGRRIPFGQDLLVASLASEVSEQDVEQIRLSSQHRARASLDEALEQGGLDLLVAIGAAMHVPYCAAGYPALNVPAGFREDGEPVGLTFIGRAGDEDLLVRAAYAFEQATAARRPPDL